MVGIGSAEAFEGGVFVMEELDEDVLGFSSAEAGGQEGADPAVVGGEAAACCFC